MNTSSVPLLRSSWFVWGVVLVALTWAVGECTAQCVGYPDYGKVNADFEPTGMYIPRSAWGARPYAGDCAVDPSVIIAMDNVTRITIHHTYMSSPSSLEEGMAEMREIQDLHQLVNGWVDIGYQFVVDRMGHVYQSRTYWDDGEMDTTPTNSSAGYPRPGFVQGNHAGGANENNLGISAMGCYDSQEACGSVPATPIVKGDVLYNQLVSLVSYYATVFHIPLDRDHILGHREAGTTPTTCPGQHLYDLLDDIVEDARTFTRRSESMQVLWIQ